MFGKLSQEDQQAVQRVFLLLGRPGRAPRTRGVALRETISLLEPTRDRAHRFRGSHAQRDVLTLTLIEAALRAGRLPLARHYIAERTVHKPASGWGWRLLARAPIGRGGRGWPML